MIHQADWGVSGLGKETGGNVGTGGGPGDPGGGGGFWWRRESRQMGEVWNLEAGEHRGKRERSGPNRGKV